MSPKLRRVPWVISVSLPIYCLMSLVAWTLESSGALPNWAEPLYTALFVVPILILCEPWYPLLSQWKLMQGGWIRIPSPLGAILVFAIYTMAAVVAGLLFNRRRS